MFGFVWKKIMLITLSALHFPRGIRSIAGISNIWFIHWRHLLTQGPTDFSFRWSTGLSIHGQEREVLQLIFRRQRAVQRNFPYKARFEPPTLPRFPSYACSSVQFWLFKTSWYLHCNRQLHLPSHGLTWWEYKGNDLYKFICRSDQKTMSPLLFASYAV